MVTPGPVPAATPEARGGAWFTVESARYVDSWWQPGCLKAVVEGKLSWWSEPWAMHLIILWGLKRSSLRWDGKRMKMLSVRHVHFHNSLDCSPPGSSVHEILQARILEWVVIPFSRATSRPRDWPRLCSSLVPEYVLELKFSLHYKRKSLALQADPLLFETPGKLPPSHLGHPRVVSRAFCAIQQTDLWFLIFYLLKISTNFGKSNII